MSPNMPQTLLGLNWLPVAVQWGLMLRVHSAHCRLAAVPWRVTKVPGWWSSWCSWTQSLFFLSFFPVLCLIMCFISVKAYGQVKTHFWKCVCWDLDIYCQRWGMKESEVETYPACWYDTGSVKFGCHLCKVIEKRFEWQWPQVTIT